MNKNSWSRLFILLIVLSLVVFLSGCEQSDGKEPDIRPDTNEKVQQNVILYFSDDQAMYLEAEERSITVEKDKVVEQLPLAVAEELIKGPEGKSLFPTIPPEARVLKVEVSDHTAYADFSVELRSKHGGGSAGELMTIGSIVNSLTELEGIEKVQILIEGEVQETLAGHMDLSQPFERMEDLLQ